MSGKSYRIGVFLGRNKAISACVALALAGYAMWPAPSTVSTKVAASSVVGSPSDILKRATLAGTKVPNPCDTGADERLAKARTAMLAANPEVAFEHLQACRSTLTGYAKTVFVQALTQSNAKREKVADAEAKRIRTEKKLTGVLLGMSQQDALDSSWGKPQKINRTTNAYGVSEQWVYIGSYLYFKDGVLTSIQN